VPTLANVAQGPRVCEGAPAAHGTSVRENQWGNKRQPQRLRLGRLAPGGRPELIANNSGFASSAGEIMGKVAIIVLAIGMAVLIGFSVWVIAL
jgi:hypothetical protein